MDRKPDLARLLLAAALIIAALAHLPRAPRVPMLSLAVSTPTLQFSVAL